MSNTAEGRVNFTQALDTITKEEFTAVAVLGGAAGAVIGFATEQIATDSQQRYQAGYNISSLQDENSNLNVWINQAKTKQDGTTVKFLSQIRTNNFNQIATIEAATPKNPDTAEIVGFEAGGILVGIIGFTALAALLKRKPRI